MVRKSIANLNTLYFDFLKKKSVVTETVDGTGNKTLQNGMYECLYVPVGM